MNETVKKCKKEGQVNPRSDPNPKKDAANPLPCHFESKAFQIFGFRNHGDDWVVETL
jgi:hypothetical protein